MKIVRTTPTVLHANRSVTVEFEPGEQIFTHQKPFGYGGEIRTYIHEVTGAIIRSSAAFAPDGQPAGWETKVTVTADRIRKDGSRGESTTVNAWDFRNSDHAPHSDALEQFDALVARLTVEYGARTIITAAETAPEQS